MEKLVTDEAHSSLFGSIQSFSQISAFSPWRSDLSDSEPCAAFSAAPKVRAFNSSCLSGIKSLPHYQQTALKTRIKACLCTIHIPIAVEATYEVEYGVLEARSMLEDGKDDMNCVKWK
ncbi:hypothetical protein C1H46_003741 [Malus baccata]|uniref:Uncharacterized protein n=1 Tax=Malus baccata TaxID=106549 RepID=A0A540NHV6_MALBA|nr:hypothetical protein C1H46_003741 [Malus baccata]